MKVIRKNQYSLLLNNDVKWYLFDEKLWITKCKDYSEIEKSILKSIGSFNWLYEINDTLLFNMEGGFETAIIDLAGKIATDTYSQYANIIQIGKKGNIFLEEKKNSDFEFSSSVIYSEDNDALYSFPISLEKEKLSIVFVVDDFGFVIVDHDLQGWILKNASQYIYIAEENNQDITPHILARYFKALEMLGKKGDSTELKKMLEEDEIQKSKFFQAFKECIMNLL